MSNKIKLTPSELQSQANEMKSLQAEYVSLFGGVTGELNKVNTNWSPNLANNFSGKITSAQKSFTQVTQMLMDGAEVADTCAVTFESVDSQLSKKMYCDDTTDFQNKNSFIDVAADRFSKIPAEWNQLQEVADHIDNWLDKNENVNRIWNVVKRHSSVARVIDLTKSVIEDPLNVAPIAWSVLESVPVFGTALKWTEDIMDQIPFYHDFYESRGGYSKGLIKGIGEIYDCCKDYCKKNGGFISSWWHGVKSMFN